VPIRAGSIFSPAFQCSSFKAFPPNHIINIFTYSPLRLLCPSSSIHPFGPINGCPCGPLHNYSCLFADLNCPFTVPPLLWPFPLFHWLILHI
jgi:hypothetical protein